MKSILLIFIFIGAIGCSNVKFTECTENNNIFFVGNGSVIYKLDDRNEKVVDSTYLTTQNDSIPEKIQSVQCAIYLKAPFFIFYHENNKYLINKSIAFVNSSDAVEYARSNSNPNYSPKYSQSSGYTTETGPRGGKYHLSPSGKKVYDSSKKSNSSRGGSRGRR